MNRSSAAKTKSASSRLDAIRPWSVVRRELFNSSVLNKDSWDITLSSGIEVNFD